jgi:hypothetical protein
MINNKMEKEQHELSNINNDNYYYNGDVNYLILPNDKEKRKRDNDRIKEERIFKRFNDNNENYQYIGEKLGYDIYVKKQKIN